MQPPCHFHRYRGGGRLLSELEGDVFGHQITAGESTRLIQSVEIDGTVLDRLLEHLDSS